MKKYTSYKPSRVEWIGDIPEHWIVKKMKYFVRICNGSDYKDFVLEEGGYPVYGTGGIFSRCSKFLYDEVSVLLGRKGSVDKPQIVYEPFWTSDTTYYTQIKVNVSPKYFFHLVNQIQFDRYIYGSAIPSMTKSVYDDMLFPYPPIHEQHQIVQFLDEKTEIIDKLISTKERKIDLLKEQRTSLINQVITKGLDPNVKMKYSGVEWIGEIPEHWNISKFKYDTFTPVQYGLNISGDKYKEEGIRFIRITDLTEEGELILEDGKYLDEIEVPKEFFLNKYDVLFCRSGHTVGKSYLHLQDGKYTSGGYLVRFNFGNYYQSKFIFYLGKTSFYWDWIKLNSVVSTIENVNGDKYQNFQYPKPSNEEQQQIVNYLETITKEIDDLVSLEQRKIEVLKEYRQSLISEVITGKIDVRTNVN